MSAWVLALFSLIPHTDLAVYLHTDANQPSAPLENMKRELSGIMQAAGYRVVYGDPRKPDIDSRFSTLVVLELRGRCAMPAGNYRLERSVASGASLAETSVADGIVMPFSYINCANLTRMIGPVLGDEASAQRDYFYGRAMGRVAAHELYHVMMGSQVHRHQGVAKPSFSVADLLNDGFEFDHIALALLRHKAGEVGQAVVPGSLPDR
jgi:hypothetical protein